MTRNWILGSVAAAALVGLEARPAAACVCAGSPTIDALARRAPAVVVGRVTARGELLYDADPFSVDIDVEWVAKGDVASTPVRIWNVMAGSDCGGTLKPLAVGARVVFAVRQVASMPAENREMWPLMRFHPEESDLMLIGACGEPVRVLKTDREADRWVGRTLSPSDEGVDPKLRP